MPFDATTRTRCPECRKKYAVPREAIGHRVRCPACAQVFRATEYVHQAGQPPFPTEDDIIRWLNEAEEGDTPPPRPRVIAVQAPRHQPGDQLVAISRKSRGLQPDRAPRDPPAPAQVPLPPPSMAAHLPTGGFGAPPAVS